MELAHSKIKAIKVTAMTVPTDFPESDGTLSWTTSTLVLVEITAAGKTGIGFTYADPATARLIEDKFAHLLINSDPMDIPGHWCKMFLSCRHLGISGIVSMAISAVDIALWDLKARILGLPLVSLLGQLREGIPVYASGGFTSYPIPRLQKQLSEWVSQGILQVKIKVGQIPGQDIHRVYCAREAIGEQTELFVDAGGAYSRKEALAMANDFAVYGVHWFEDPVVSEDWEGLHFLRDNSPGGMAITTGQSGSTLSDFQKLLAANTVDILQADATRCGGITGFLKAAALCEANSIPLTPHGSPTIHLHPGCASPAISLLEYFHDHVRVERLFFDGFISPINGLLEPDLSRPGMGIELKRANMKKFAA